MNWLVTGLLARPTSDLSTAFTAASSPKLAKRQHWHSSLRTMRVALQPPGRGCPVVAFSPKDFIGHCDLVKSSDADAEPGELRGRRAEGFCAQRLGKEEEGLHQHHPGLGFLDDTYIF